MREILHKLSVVAAIILICVIASFMEVELHEAAHGAVCSSYGGSVLSTTIYPWYGKTTCCLQGIADLQGYYFMQAAVEVVHYPLVLLMVGYIIWLVKKRGDND